MILQADDDVVRAAFRRLTQPAKGATYTHAELVVLLNQSDDRVPTKTMARALSLCLENKVRRYSLVDCLCEYREREGSGRQSNIPTSLLPQTGVMDESVRPRLIDAWSTTLITL